MAVADSSAEDLSSTTAATVSIEEPTTQTASTEFDDVVSSNSTRWVGQELFLKAPGNDGDTYSLNQVNDDDGSESVGSIVTQIPLDENGEATFNTENAEGGQDYVITNENGQPVIFDENGVQDTTTSNVDNADFEITDQTISAEFNETTVNNGGTDTVRGLELDSNRAGYMVEISADGLDTDDFQDIFGVSEASDADEGLDGVTEGTFEDDGTDYVRLEVPRESNPEIDADFDDIDPGTYNFSVEVADTDDEAEASIEVRDQDADLDLTQSVIRDQAGDVVEFTVETQSTDDAYVIIGGEDVNMLERVHVEDDDDDGQITFEMNTFLAGSVSMANASQAYDSEDDSIESVSRPRPSGLDIEDNLSDPMGTGDYDVFVSSSETVNANDDDDLVIPDEQDGGVLTLEDGNISNVQTWIAPSGENLDDREEVLDNVVESSTVAEGDQAVIQLTASGLAGYVDEDAEDFVNNEGLYVVVEEADAGANQDPEVLDLTAGGVNVVEDEENDTYFLTINTNNAQTYDGSSLDEGDWTVRAVLAGDGSDFIDDDAADRYPFSDFSTSPYVDDDEQLEASTSLTVEEADAEFQNRQDDVVQIQQNENASVTATTNVAPGTDLTMRLSTEGRLFTQTVEVSDDQTLTANFDTSELDVDTELTAQVRSGGTELASSDAIVVEQQETDTETDTETTTPAETTTPGETTTGDGETTTTTTTTTTAGGTGGDGGDGGTPTDGDGPGFGAVVAVIALLAAALLAVRREN